MVATYADNEFPFKPFATNIGAMLKTFDKDIIAVTDNHFPADTVKPLERTGTGLIVTTPGAAGTEAGDPAIGTNYLITTGSYASTGFVA